MTDSISIKDKSEIERSDQPQGTIIARKTAYLFVQYKANTTLLQSWNVCAQCQGFARQMRSSS